MLRGRRATRRDPPAPSRDTRHTTMTTTTTSSLTAPPRRRQRRWQWHTRASGPAGEEGRREKDRLTDADQVHRAGRNQGSREERGGRKKGDGGGGNLGGMRSTMMGAIADNATPRDVAGREGSVSVILRKGRRIEVLGSELDHSIHPTKPSALPEPNCDCDPYSLDALCSQI